MNNLSSIAIWSISLLENYKGESQIDNVLYYFFQELKETQTKDLIAEAKKKQDKIERRLDFLRRKVRKIQARHMGQHVSDEIAGVYEYVHRTLKHLKDSSTALDDDSSIFSPLNTFHQQHYRPISTSATKSLLKKLEMAATLQSNSVSRQRPVKYFGSGSTEPTTFRINVPGIIELPSWPVEHKLELQKVTGLLHSEIRVVQQDLDSEATESSSGGESCDEFQNYPNPHQQYLSM